MTSNVVDASPLFSKLSEHPEYIRFFVVNSVNKKAAQMDQNLAPENQYIIDLSTLTNFYNLKLLRNSPRNFTRKIDRCDHLNGNEKMLYHKLLYAEKKIFCLQKKKHIHDVEFLGGLINFIDENKPNQIQIPAVLTPRVDVITDFIMSDSDHIARMKLYLENNLKRLRQASPYDSDQNFIHKEMNDIISYFQKMIDQETYLLPNDQISLKFDYYLSRFQFKDIFLNIINKFNDLEQNTFIQILFDSINTLTDYFNFDDVYRNISFVSLIFRYIFDQIYQTNIYYFPQTQCKDILKDLRKVITLRTLDLPLDYLPKDINIDLEPIEFFRNDVNFKDSVSELENISFITNPLDILGAIHKSLLIIEKAATVYSSHSVLIFPFEVTFGLFLGALISSDIPELQNMAKFVDDCTPRSGLCPAIEFSKAKLLGGSFQCTEMHKKMVSEG